MQIYPARRNELMEAAKFLNACWRWAYRDILTPADLKALTHNHSRYHRMRKRYAAGPRPLLLRNNDELLGYCLFGPSQTKGWLEDGEIKAIYVRADAIGKGYGHALLTRAQEELYAQGYAHLVLDVLSQNARAIAFYRAHGFSKVGEAAFHKGRRAYPLDIMRK